MIRRKSLRKPSYRPYKKPLILVGMRANIFDIVTLAAQCNYKIVGILDQYYYGNIEKFSDIPIIGDERWLLDKENQIAQSWLKDAYFICSSWWMGHQHVDKEKLNDEQVRIERINILANCNARLATLIDSTAEIEPSVEIGQGTIIMGGVKIGRSVQIGKNSFIDWQSGISYGVVIGDNCIIGLRNNLANCILGNHIRTGTNATMLGGSKKDYKTITIGDNCIIHSCSFTCDDLPPNHVRTYNNRTISRMTL